MLHDCERSACNWADLPTPQVDQSEPTFGVDNVTVNLEMFREKESGTGVFHNISILPNSPSTEILYTERGVQVIVPYNIAFDLSIVAVLCGRQSARKVIELSYSECIIYIIISNNNYYDLYS